MNTIQQIKEYLWPTQFIEIEYSKGRFRYDYTYGLGNKYPHLGTTIEEIIMKFDVFEYHPTEVLQFAKKHLESVYKVEVKTSYSLIPLFIDDDGANVLQDDTVYVTNISIQGPTVTELSAVQYYRQRKMFDILRKLNMVLRVTKTKENSFKNFESYLSLWKSTKNEE